MQKTALLPTTEYNCSSWGFSAPGQYTIPAKGELLLPLSVEHLKWNIVKEVFGEEAPGAEIVSPGVIQVRQPNRNMRFKVKALYSSSEAFNVVLREGENEIAFLQSLGEDTINYTTDSLNLKEGFDPLSLVLVNPNHYDITVDFSTLDFYNLFSIYETNEDDFLVPQGFMFPVADNFPEMTALELYREILTLFQMAQTSVDDLQEVDYYLINEIPQKTFERVDVNPYVRWNGYTILSQNINGLAKLNAIRYNADTKRSRYFRVDIAPLAASGVYFNSMFSHGQTSKSWGAMIVPGLKYKTKTVDGINYEYMEFSQVSPQIGYYDETTGAMLFDPLHITKIVEEYWSNLLTFMSSFDGYNPVVFDLNLRLFYYQYLELFGQRNLFFFNSNALLLSGKYDVLNESFTGTFISLR